MPPPDAERSTVDTNDNQTDGARTTGQGQQQENQQFEPGEIAPHWYSPFPNAVFTEEEKKAIKELCDLVGKKDVAARRWEVEQSWEARLFDRGYQYLLPRKGGGWTLPPFATDYNRKGGAGKKKFSGFPVNIYTTYGEIVGAALSRDIPGVHFQPRDPMNNACVTAADSATKFAKVFGRNNDLMGFQHQLVYYLRNDGRAVIVTDYVLDSQRFGRDIPEAAGAVPETETQLSTPLGYVMRHGETPQNADDVERGRSDTPLNATGAGEVDKALDFLKDKGITKIISSPLERTMESSELASGSLGIPYDVDDRFASLDLGDFQGQPRDAVHDQIADFAKNPEMPIPGGESFGNLDARVQEGTFEQTQARKPGPTAGETTGPFLIITHNSVISSMNRLFTGVDDGGADFIPPGGIAAIYEAPEGGFTFRPVFPPEQKADATPIKRGKPRGMEVVECYGKLEGKVPINTQTIYDCDFVQVAREWDIARAKAMFPDIADEIKPGGAGSGENELDRIARINSALGLEASYVTGDSMVRDCTIQRTWFRPSFFMEIKDETARNGIFEKCPDGLMACFAGDAFAFGRNECMDDHVTIVQAFPGSGQNRIALMSKVIPVAKRLNNWVDLLNSYFVRTVPWKWYDNDTFDVEMIRTQSNEPGMAGPFQSQVGKTVDQLIFVEPQPQHQPAMPDFINMFINDLPQLLSGALPTLFGAESNTDTVGGLAIQRDQALGRLGTPWHAIKYATCSYFRQAVQLAGKCRKRGIHESVGNEIIDIELADLKGEVLCYPEESPGFPESEMQRRAQYEKLLMDATNPIIMAFLQLPKNLKIARDAVGMSAFEIPGATNYDKQLGEMKVLLRSGPVDNPEKKAIALKLAKSTAVVGQDKAAGIPVDPQDEALLVEMQKMMESLPDLVSTVAIDKETDDHVSEKAALLDWINSPEGRRYRNGLATQKAAFNNVRTHYLEHDAADMEKKAAAAKAAQPPEKPVSVSANAKDAPPDVAMQVWEKAGFTPSPEDAQVTKIEKAKDIAPEPKPQGVTVQ